MWESVHNIYIFLNKTVHFSLLSLSGIIGIQDDANLEILSLHKNTFQQKIQVSPYILACILSVYTRK